MAHHKDKENEFTELEQYISENKNDISNSSTIESNISDMLKLGFELHCQPEEENNLYIYESDNVVLTAPTLHKLILLGNEFLRIRNYRKIKNSKPKVYHHQTQILFKD